MKLFLGDRDSCAWLELNPPRLEDSDFASLDSGISSTMLLSETRLSGLEVAPGGGFLAESSCSVVEDSDGDSDSDSEVVSVLEDSEDSVSGLED